MTSNARSNMRVVACTHTRVRAARVDNHLSIAWVAGVHACTCAWPERATHGHVHSRAGRVCQRHALGWQGLWELVNPLFLPGGPGGPRARCKGIQAVPQRANLKADLPSLLFGADHYLIHHWDPAWCRTPNATRRQHIN